MKTVYITESMLRDSVLASSLPDDILEVIERGKTSLGNNPALPDVFEDNFIESVVMKRFKEVSSRLSELGIEGTPEELSTRLSRDFVRCQELERPMRSQLEKVCYNYVVDLFRIPEDSMKIELNLVDEIDYSKYTISVDQDKAIGGDELDDVEQMRGIRESVYKRRLLNCLSMGAGMYFSSNIRSYLDDVRNINPELPSLYKEILAINEYLIFTKNNLGIDDENRMQAGTVQVNISAPDEMPSISTEAKTFPILLSETIRGLMELFASHGLPSDKRLARIVVGRADFIKSEPWDMRLGPALWTILYNVLDDNPELIPYEFSNISRLKTESFNRFFNEVLSGTRLGRKLAYDVVCKSETEFEAEDADKMEDMDDTKTIITDEFQVDF